MISIKSEYEIQQMKKAGIIVAQILDEIASWIKPGVSTHEIDAYAEKQCQKLGALPAFKGYQGFPASICVSINDEVVHGIPSKERILGNGDIIGIDFGVSYQGWFSDSARTLAVGTISQDAEKLIQVTQDSLFKGIEQCKVGNRISDIGHAVQNYVESYGYHVVREYVGHGIGQRLHEEPLVPNYGIKGQGCLLKPGMVLAIEPMVNIGDHRVKVLNDGWTVVTVDGSWSAHFEHTVLVTLKGPEILTLTLSERK